MSDTIHKPRLGLYAGSFDPFHIGHLDIVRQAMEEYDEVLVAKGVNPEKFSKITTRYPLPENFLRELGVKWTTYDTLLVDLIKVWEKHYKVTLVRGLRNEFDLGQEQNFIAFLKGMHKVRVVAFHSEPQYRHISSSALRGIEHFSDAEYRKYVVEN